MTVSRKALAFQLIMTALVAGGCGFMIRDLSEDRIERQKWRDLKKANKACLKMLKKKWPDEFNAAVEERIDLDEEFRKELEEL